MVLVDALHLTESRTMFRTRFAVAFVAVALAGSARGADTAAATVLTPDAKGFLHVRVADVWASDVAKQLRAFTAQAGAGLLADFDGQFYPAPSEIESFTVVLFDPRFRDVYPMGSPTDVTPVWVVTSKKPLQKAELLKTMAKTGRAKKHGGKDYYFDENNWSGILLLDEHSYAYASEDSITKLIDRMAKAGEVKSSLAEVFARGGQAPGFARRERHRARDPGPREGRAAGVRAAAESQDTARGHRPEAEDDTERGARLRHRGRGEGRVEGRAGRGATGPRADRPSPHLR